MEHLNSILEREAREFLRNIAQRTRHKYVFDSETLIPKVEDTGERHDVTNYLDVRHFLQQPAECESSQSLREVLRSHLVRVASERTKRPERAAKALLDNLDRRSLSTFLSIEDGGDVKRRVVSLRHRLNRCGFRLAKSRTRDPLKERHGVYDVIDRATHEINLDAPRGLQGLEGWARTLASTHGPSLQSISRKKVTPTNFSARAEFWREPNGGAPKLSRR